MRILLVLILLLTSSCVQRTIDLEINDCIGTTEGNVGLVRFFLRDTDGGITAIGYVDSAEITRTVDLDKYTKIDVKYCGIGC